MDLETIINEIFPVQTFVNPKEQLDQGTLKRFFVPNKDIPPDQLAYAVRCIKSDEGKNIFELAGIRRNEETTIMFLGNYYRSGLIDYLPSAIDETAELPSRDDIRRYLRGFLPISEIELELLMDGYQGKNSIPFNDPTTLSRHLDRSAAIGQNLVEACLTGQGIQLMNVAEIRDFGNRHFDGLYPYHLPIGLHFHDAARRVTHTSRHDDILPKLVDRIGLVDTIRSSFHEPVPSDYPLQEKYDRSGAQMLSRISDVFGKVYWVNDFHGWGRRVSPDSVLAHSRERQLHYFAREKDDPRSTWFGKSTEHLEIYLDNEKRVLDEAIDWFEDKSHQKIEAFMSNIHSFRI